MDSAFAKLRRAKGHHDQLHTEVGAYRARDPLGWEWHTHEHPWDPELAVVKFHVRVREELPGIDWGLIVGDVLTNLRAALDHSVYSHVESRGLLTASIRDKLYFPTVRHVNEWSVKQAELGPLMDPAVLAVIEQHQPFQHSPVDEDVLAVLGGLVNRDKHRALRVVSQFSEDFTVEAAGLDVERAEPSRNELTDNAVAATMVVRRPRSAPGQKKAIVRPHNFHVVNAYVESIELPTATPRRHGVLSVVDALVGRVDRVLADMKAAGC